jgi:putative endonuclease
MKQPCVYKVSTGWLVPNSMMDVAISRDKQLKHRRREWKLALIERDNPEWEDLYPLFVPGAGPSLSRG